MWSPLTLGLVLVATCSSAALAENETRSDTRRVFASALEKAAAGRVSEARALYEQILKSDPNHRAARRALGYIRVDGVWTEEKIARRAVLLPALRRRRGALVRAALHDPRRTVRIAAAEALAGLNDPDATDQLLLALAGRSSRGRARAAEALAEIGDARTLPHLIHRWELSSGDYPRSYFAQMAQVAYIADFDVEIA